MTMAAETAVERMEDDPRDDWKWFRERIASASKRYGGDVGKVAAFAQRLCKDEPERFQSLLPIFAADEAKMVARGLVNYEIHAVMRRAEEAARSPLPPAQAIGIFKVCLFGSSVPLGKWDAKERGRVRANYLRLGNRCAEVVKFVDRLDARCGEKSVEEGMTEAEFIGLDPPMRLLEG